MISIGIDISKEKSMICALKPYGEVLFAPDEVNHTESELEDFINKISLFDDEIRIVMEATGAYHLPVLMKLQEKGFFVSVINPLLMKKYSSNTLRKGKTDKIDSIKIANYGLDNWFHLKSHQMTDEIHEELKLLGRQYAHYIGMRVQGKNALTNILDRVMPRIKTLLRSIRSDDPTKDKLADFAEHYWHYDNIICLSEEEFVLSYNTWAKEKGYHQSEAKALAIYKIACDSISTLSSSNPSTKTLVIEAVKTQKGIASTLNIILTRMNEIAQNLPEYSVVRKMTGVGDILAVRLIAEIGDVTRFHNGSSLVAFAGIDSPSFESGSFVGTKRNISKRGSGLLRKTGYEVMKCLKTVKPTTDSAVYEFMLKKESEGKPKKVAKIAALNKFLRIYYARVSEVYRN